MKIYLLLFIISSNAFSYFLITNNGAAFNSKKVSINITSNSTCTNTGWSANDILDMAIEGSKATWNKVGRANITVKKGSSYTTSDANFLTGELCIEDSVTTCGAGTVPKVTSIVIACNDNGTNFPNNTVLAISGPNNISGSKINGAVVLLNNRADSQLGTFSRAEMEKVLAHEIGHALGIGHSEDKDALMYHEDIKNKNRLAKDDINALGYLYPYSSKDMSCLGFLGSIKNQGNKNYWNNGLGILSIGFLSIILVLKLFQSLWAILSNNQRKVYN